MSSSTILTERRVTEEENNNNRRILPYAGLFFNRRLQIRNNELNKRFIDLCIISIFFLSRTIIVRSSDFSHFSRTKREIGLLSICIFSLFVNYAVHRINGSVHTYAHR